MKKYLYIFLLVISLVLALHLPAQVKVSASIDTSYMFIGDQTYFRFHASIPKEFTIDFPLLTNNIVKDVEILEVGKIDTIENNGLLILEQTYKLTSFDSGWYSIPEMKFIVHKPNDIKDTVLSKSVFFGVQTIALDTLQKEAIADIKKPVNTPLTFKELLPFILYGYLAAIILGAVLYVYLKYGKKKKLFTIKEKPKEPAHIIALEKLDILKEQKLWQRGLNKEYYSAITDIIRTYIEDRFGIPAMEQTTDEILEAFRFRFEIEKELKMELANLLMRADFVKFAKALPGANENEASMEFAFHFIIKTKPVEILRDDEINKVQN